MRVSSTPILILSILCTLSSPFRYSDYVYHKFLISPVHAKCTAHLAILELMKVMV
jgi:hypothetical protein